MKRSFKKALSIGLVLVLAMSLAACQKPVEPAPEATAYTAGSYTATEKGHNGDVTVKVDFSDEAITAIEITEHKESPGISDPAIADIPAAILEFQSLGVDAIGGATVTSNAILAAVENCVTQAGGDVEALKSAPAKKA